VQWRDCIVFHLLEVPPQFRKTVRSAVRVSVIVGSGNENEEVRLQPPTENWM
jgi:hypothetical protein